MIYYDRTRVLSDQLFYLPDRVGCKGVENTEMNKIAIRHGTNRAIDRIVLEIADYNVVTGVKKAF